MCYRFLYHYSPGRTENLHETADPELKNRFIDLRNHYPNSNEAIKVVARKGFTLGLSPRINKFPCIDVMKGEEFIARLGEP